MAIYVKKKSLAATLRQMSPGDTIHIPERDFRYDVIRQTCYRLRAQGVNVTASCRGTLGTNVTRLP